MIPNGGINTSYQEEIEANAYPIEITLKRELK